MKIAKILSAAAACAVAVAAFATTASAELAVSSNPASNLTSGTGMWMVKLYVPNEGVDVGIDCTEIGSVVFTITVPEEEQEWFEGQIGGAVIVSSGPVLDVDHNWPQKSYWGVVDEALELDSHDGASDLQTVKVGDYTYQLTCPVDDTNNVIAEAYAEESAYVQVALGDWSTDMAVIAVDSLNVLDTNGNSLIAFDGDGNVISAAAPAAPAEDTTSADTDTTTTTTTTTPDKGSPDTGVEGVAAVAGLAVVAAGAVVLSKKRK